MITKNADLEKRLDFGLRGQWYVVAKSAEVTTKKPLAVYALGQDLVLWRGEDGIVRCLDDVCPHRAARLSRGEIMGSHVSCRYHGVTVDGSGTVVSVPGMLECSLEGKTAVRSYPVQEAADGVFVYFASSAKPQPSELVLPPELVDHGYARFLCSAPWKCNYRFVLDNVADPMHGIFLHSDTFTLSRGLKQDTVKTEETDHGFIVKRVGQQEVNFDWGEIIVEGPVMYTRVPIPYPAAAGPGGALIIIALVTPVDEDNCRIYFWRTRAVANDFEREAWRFQFRAALEARAWHVIEQDRDMLEHMPRDARDHEMLYQHDTGIVRLRRVLNRKAQEEVSFSGELTQASA